MTVRLYALVVLGIAASGDGNPPFAIDRNGWSTVRHCRPRFTRLDHAPETGFGQERPVDSNRWIGDNPIKFCEHRPERNDARTTVLGVESVPAQSWPILDRCFAG